MLALAAAGSFLAACDRSATVEEGIAAEMKAATAPAGNTCAAGVTVADEGQSFCRASGERIDLINGLVVPFPLRVIACPTAASLLADWLMPAALAHGGHVDAPAGVVDVAAPTGTEWALGELPLAPGRYCAVELALTHLPSGTLPAETVPDPSGVFLYARPCFFPHPPPAPPEHDHACHTVAVSGTSPTLTLDFAAPVVLDANHRRLPIAVVVRHDTWFDGVDFTRIDTDPAERARVVQNVVDSIDLDEISP